MSQPYQWRGASPDPTPRPTPTATPQTQHTDDQKEEAAAAIGAFNELGPQYQDAVIESFLNRMDQMQAQRQPPPQPQLPQPIPMTPYQMRKAKSNGPAVAMLVICLAMSIPLTAIAANYAGFFGVVISWVGIVLVAYVLGRGLNHD